MWYILNVSFVGQGTFSGITTIERRTWSLDLRSGRIFRFLFLYPQLRVIRLWPRVSGHKRITFAIHRVWNPCLLRVITLRFPVVRRREWWLYVRVHKTKLSYRGKRCDNFICGPSNLPSQLLARTHYVYCVW